MSSENIRCNSADETASAGPAESQKGGYQKNANTSREDTVWISLKKKKKKRNCWKQQAKPGYQRADIKNIKKTQIPWKDLNLGWRHI